MLKKNQIFIKKIVNQNKIIHKIKKIKTFYILILLFKFELEYDEKTLFCGSCGDELEYEK